MPDDFGGELLVCPRLHLLRSLLLPKSDLQEGVERSKDLIL